MLFLAMNQLFRLLSAFCLFLVGVSCDAQNEKPLVLLRVDDIGMNHSVNMAVEKLAASGIPFSTSVMFACPWYQETVDILKKYPKVTVGVHLTLNAEWKYYRWGPILGKEGVPSLVDSLGYFLPSVQAFASRDYKLAEVERELDAQIKRAIGTGLKIRYVDWHMGTANLTPELRAIVKKLASKYNLGISTFFNEEYKSMWPVPVASKKAEFLEYLKKELIPGNIHVVELHIAERTPEMDVLVDLNSTQMRSKDGRSEVSQHRETELNMLLSEEFKSLIGKKFDLTSYGEVIDSVGLNNMKDPY